MTQKPETNEVIADKCLGWHKTTEAVLEDIKKALDAKDSEILRLLIRHGYYQCQECLGPMVGVSNGVEYRASGYVDKYCMAKVLLESVGFTVIPPNSVKGGK